MRQKATIGKISEVGWYSPSLSKDWNQLYTIKVEIAKRRGEQVPETWGVESGGHLTTNPEKILAGGGLFPLGGSEISAVLITVSFVRKYDLATGWKRTSAIGNEREKKSCTTIACSRTPCPKEDLLKYKQKKILEAAQRRTSLKKCRRDLREYNIPLAALLSENGTRTSSRREIEITAERLYSSFFRSSTPVSSPIIPTGEAPPRILPSEVRVAIKRNLAQLPDLILYQLTFFGLGAVRFM
ncbi:hypothetical protein RB195_018725 [Necator americanus]|uniref:Uncharacterized protein n=1 Tax=Necator americanus TaxID=51031 RepID=A0ABR1CD71_NECAM